MKCPLATGSLALLSPAPHPSAPGHVAVVEHEWGTDIYRPADGPLSLPFDLVVACDVMYVHEAVPALMDSLLQLARNAESAHRGSEDSCCLDAGHHCCEVIVAHGRNRPAEELFVTTAKREGFDVQEVPGRELDEVYQCSDVTVLRLLPLRNGARGS